MRFNILLLVCSFFISIITTGQDALNMTLLGQWDDNDLPITGGVQYNDLWGYVDCEGNEYAIVGGASHILFIDITNPTNPQFLQKFEGGLTTIWRDIKTYKNYAYSGSEANGEGLMIFDMSGLPNDTITKVLQTTEFFGKSHNIYIDEQHGRLYAVGTNTQSQGVIILDIATDPANPTLLASVQLQGGGYVHDMYVKDNIGYCSHGNNGLYIWDFTNPTTPVQIANVNTGAYNHSSWITDDGQHLIYAEETVGKPLGILDVSDPIGNGIDIINTFSFPLLAPEHTNNIAHNPYIRGDYAFVSYYEDGVQVFDISDVNNPQQVAYYDTSPNTTYSGTDANWGVYPFLPSGNIIATDMEIGLVVLSADSLDLKTIENRTIEASVSNLGESAFCEGESTTLEVTFNENYTYQWYKNDVQIENQTTNQLEVSETGTYYAIVDNDKACSKTLEPITIIVTPFPNTTISANDTTTFCNGNDVILSVAGGADTYTWYRNGASTSNATNNYTVTESGFYHVVASTNGCTSMSDSIEVSVIDFPVVTVNMSGATTICEGDSIELKANPVGLSYAWFRNDEPMNITTQSINVSDAATYQVEVSNQGCVVMSDIITTTIQTLPSTDFDIIGSTTLCTGQFVEFEVIDTNLDSYSWTKDDIEVGTNPNILITTQGEYRLTTTKDGCSNTSNPIFVTVLEAAVPTISANANTLTTIEGASYQWYFNSQIVAGGTQQNLEASENGVYNVQITYNNGCTAISDDFNFVLDAITPISSIHTLDLYPNPTNQFVTLDFQTNKNIDLIIEVLSTTGQVLIHKNISIVGEHQEILNLQDIPTGVYFIKMTDGNGVIVKKVIKR